MPGSGSCNRASHPRAPARFDNVNRPPCASVEQHRLLPGPGLPTEPPRTTVLVVDDEDGIRSALERFLTRLGYRVVLAASGAEAMAALGREKPMALLSDIRMPEMTGVDLVPKVL